MAQSAYDGDDQLVLMKLKFVQLYKSTRKIFQRDKTNKHWIRKRNRVKVQKELVYIAYI